MFSFFSYFCFSCLDFVIFFIFHVLIFFSFVFFLVFIVSIFFGSFSFCDIFHFLFLCGTTNPPTQPNTRRPTPHSKFPCLWRHHHHQHLITTATLSSSLKPPQHQNLLITTTSSCPGVLLRSHLGSTSSMCPDFAIIVHQETECRKHEKSSLLSSSVAQIILQSVCFCRLTPFIKNIFGSTLMLSTFSSLLCYEGICWSNCIFKQFGFSVYSGVVSVYGFACGLVCVVSVVSVHVFFFLIKVFCFQKCFLICSVFFVACDIISVTDLYSL